MSTQLIRIDPNVEVGIKKYRAAGVNLKRIYLQWDDGSKRWREYTSLCLGLNNDENVVLRDLAEVYMRARKKDYFALDVARENSIAHLNKTKIFGGVMKKLLKPSPQTNKAALDMSTRTGLPHKVAESIIEKERQQDAFKDRRNSGKMLSRNSGAKKTS